MSALDDLAGRRPRTGRDRAPVPDGAATAGAPVPLRLLAGLAAGAAGWIGASGTEKVAVQLDRLVRRDPRWRVLHAVPTGEAGTELDHVVIGPAGIFTIDTRDHPASSVWVGGDTFMVDGRRSGYVRDSRRKAIRASRLLTTASGVPVEAVGLVVPVGARCLTITTPPGDVHVLRRRQVAGWLHDRPEVLPDETVEAIYDVARRPATWRAAG